MATLILLNYLCGLLTDSKHPDLHPCFAFSVCESKISLVPAAPSGRASSLTPQGQGKAAESLRGLPSALLHGTTVSGWITEGFRSGCAGCINNSAESSESTVLRVLLSFIYSFSQTPAEDALPSSYCISSFKQVFSVRQALGKWNQDPTVAFQSQEISSLTCFNLCVMPPLFFLSNILNTTIGELLRKFTSVVKSCNEVFLSFRQ